MGLLTFKTYNPVTLLVGVGFVAGGGWIVFELAPHAFSLRNWPGLAFLTVSGFMPIGIGAAVIRNQLRLRRKST